MIRSGDRRHCRTALLCLALLLPATASAQLGDALRLRIDSVFADVNRSNGPGCAVGVADGDARYLRGYGMSDLQQGTAIAARSIFHVASVSKQFTAMSVALLAEDGKLTLDDDIRSYVPELPDLGQRITLRQLMHHTSGIRDQWSLLSLAGWRFPDDLISERDVLWVLARQRGLNFTPGSEYLYSNSGYTLLAVVTQRVSGMSLRQFAEQRVFAPLGMADTHFHDDHAMVVPGRTSAYVPRGNEWRVSIPVFDTYGATSLFTTAGDLLTWMAFLDRVRSEESAWGRVVRAAETSGLLTNGRAINYGFGLSLGDFRGTRTIGHGGADAGYRAFVERYPDLKGAVAVLCNHANANPQGRAERVARAVFGDRLPPPMVEARAPEHRPSAAVREAWVGTWRDTLSNQLVRMWAVGDSIFVDGMRLRFGSDSTGTLPGVPGHLRRTTAGSAVTIRHVGGGLREPVLVKQPAPFTTFEAYAGRYRSEELDTEYEFIARSGALVREHRTLGTQVLRAVARDIFTGGGTTYLIERDRRGRVTGFVVNTGRVRGVRFVRQR